MVEGLIKGIINATNMISTPLNNIVNGVLSLIPGLSDVIDRVVNFLNYILTFVPLCLDFLMIPRQAITFLFDYYVCKYLIYFAVRGFKFTITLYNKLKP